MGFIPRITCQNCRRQYSALHGKCPHCGAKRNRDPGRASATTASVTPGTAASSRAAANNKWQLVFGAILLASVVLAVIVLVYVSINENGAAEPTPTPTASVEPTPTPTPRPTPTPEPTPAVTSVAITYGGELKTEFSARVGSETPLKATTYPLDVVAAVEWSSSDENVCTVSGDGVVTALGSGWCTIYAKCGAVSAECKVLVW
jgi:hypothetical protein